MTILSAAAERTRLGGLFMVGIPGVDIDNSTEQLIQKFRINNFIYFKRNIENPRQVKQLSQDLRQACRNSGLESPLIAIDQEGGTVARLPPPFTQFPDARLLAESAEPEKALLHYARVCTRELKSIGVNYNLAPVLDVCERDKEYFIEKRSLGDDPGNVGRLGSLIIEAMQKEGIAACAKHFPGLGAAKVDPHLQLPYVTKAASGLRVDDLEPFRQAIAVGVASIMTSHTIYQELDPEKPATMSKSILTGLLRNELGYSGVVITDDLEMGAIVKEGDLGLAALQAFGAGADLLLICHSHEKAVDALEKTADAVRRNKNLQARLKASVKRVEMMRKKFAGCD